MLEMMLEITPTEKPVAPPLIFIIINDI